MDNSETREYVKVGSFKPADEMNEKGAVIERDFYRQGNIFKDEEAYLDKEHPDKVCYIPELSDSLYTRQDFLDMCNGQEDIADRIFEAGTGSIRRLIWKNSGRKSLRNVLRVGNGSGAMENIIARIAERNMMKSQMITLGMLKNGTMKI